MQKIVLASQSPRRAALLRLAGVEFEVDAPDIDEKAAACGATAPDEITRNIARAKCRVVAARHDGRVVLASDTVVALDDEILEKPCDADDAVRMLRALSGRTHTVYTAVCVASRRGVFETQDTVRVTFRALSDEEIRAYVATGEPMDKAGAYGIQAGGAALVEGVSGDMDTAVGLPLDKTIELLQKAGN